MNDGRSKLSFQIMAIALLFTVVAWATVPLADAIDWSSDTPLTTDADWDMRSSVMQARDGTLWVVWSSDRAENQWDLFYKTSTDNGSSWSPPIRLTTHLTIDEMPSVMQARDGTLWVVWVSRRTGNPEISYKTSTNNGFTWSDVVQLTNYAGTDAGPSITQNVDGKIWVVWHRNVNGNVDIFCKTSSTNGLYWSDETRLTTHSSEDLSPSITWTWNGTVWLVWSSYRTGNFDIFYKNYTADGVPLSDATPLTTDLDWDETPSIMQAVDGTMWVVWSSERSGGQYDIYCKTSSNHGSSWSLATKLTAYNDDDEDPSIINIINRKILVVWERYRKDVGVPLNWDIFYKTSDEITPVHDVALIDMKAWGSLGFEVTWVPRGVPIYINVTVENQGTFQETFNVTVYADRNAGDVHIEIEKQTGITLNPGAKANLTFTWDTLDAAHGTYYISADATQVADEYDTFDNVILHGSRIGGICVPFQPHHTYIVAILAPVASATLFVAALGAIAIFLFKLLMSIRPRWPWHSPKKSL